MIGAVARGTTAGTTTHESAYRVHHVDIRIAGNAAPALDAVARSYTSFVVPIDTLAPHADRLAADTVPAGVRLTDHAGRTVLATTESDAVLGLLDRVVMVVLDRLADRGILGLHAGVVEIGGRAVILAGRSGRGKTTLTLGLVRAGAGWLTDELALIDADDRTMLPYPRAMHVSHGTRSLLPELSFLDDRPRHDLGGGAEWSVTADDLARAFGARAAGPTPLGAVVLLDGPPQPDAPPRLDPVIPALATMELVRGAPASEADFEGTVRRLGRVVADVPCARLRPGSLSATADAVRAWVEAHA